ncbi:MAG: N-acetyl-gamma-glutamyl-phosphate reductase [Aestuariivita sp.]|nr:N-acetyl-gamma-glutamyl-phosphate reductase [Aestuariivita sp.]MCY4202273.1 N-acetyl-gamma-glutamyl-phosphate reductase [Aestuariivita sp.]
MNHRIAILGASGYTGAELIRLVATHPRFSIVALSGERKAGMSISSVFPHLRHLPAPPIYRIDEVDFSEVDLCFCALPHKTSQQIVAHLPKSVRVVDLSADFRLRNADEYQKWYGVPHSAAALQETAVYGLTEFYRDQISTASLVAGTGCNSAAAQFALRPLLAAKAINFNEIIIDLKCGVSGAGRVLQEHLLHSELSEGYFPYAVGGTHRHLGELDQEFSQVAGEPITVQFTPHLLPVNRGVLATAYVRGDARTIHEVLSTAYAEEPFLSVLPFGEMPSTHHVRGSNFVHIGVAGDRLSGRSIVVAVLDNLVKGSSGQALQNANVMLGESETEGLLAAPLFP